MITNDVSTCPKCGGDLKYYRSNFNKQVKEYNRYVRQFPARLFLNILGYETQTYDYLDYNAPVDAPQNLFGD